MGITPDRTPGVSDEEGVILSDEGVDPSVVGEIRHNAGALKAKDSIGVYNLRQGAASYDSTVHRAEDQLVHDVAEDSFTEFEYTGNRVDAMRTYTNGTKTTKIREQEFTYTAQKVTQIVTKQYDAGGTLAETYTEAIAYTGNKATDVTGALT